MTSTVRAVHSIVAFLRGFLARDRYLTETLAGVATPEQVGDLFRAAEAR